MTRKMIIALIALAAAITLMKTRSAEAQAGCMPSPEGLKTFPGNTPSDLLNTPDMKASLGIPPAYEALANLCWEDTSLPGYPIWETCNFWHIGDIDWNGQSDDLVLVDVLCTEFAEDERFLPTFYTGSFWCTGERQDIIDLRQEVYWSPELRNAYGVPLDAANFLMVVCGTTYEAAQTCASFTHNETTEDHNPGSSVSVWFFVWLRCDMPVQVWLPIIVR